MSAAALAADHGTYAAYTSKRQPCRCDACRKAKADYIRARRDAARADAGDRSTEEFRHGTRYGYEERGCRCPACLTARRTRGLPKSRQFKHACRACGYRYALCTCPGGPRGGAA